MRSWLRPLKLVLVVLVTFSIGALFIPQSSANGTPSCPAGTTYDAGTNQ